MIEAMIPMVDVELAFMAAGHVPHFYQDGRTLYCRACGLTPVIDGVAQVEKEVLLSECPGNTCDHRYEERILIKFDGEPHTYCEACNNLLDAGGEVDQSPWEPGPSD